MSRFVKPETATLRLADGEQLIVKRRLNAGEERAMHARLYLAGVDGLLRANPLQVGLATVTAYLLDWTLSDDAGQRVPIAGLSVPDLTAVLDNLDPEAFAEVKRAIQEHELAMDAERAEAKKKAAPGATPSDPISPSPVAAAGATSGSPPSTPTSTPSS